MILFVISITLKLILDGIAFVVFIRSLNFFVARKKQSLKREALGFSPFNTFILLSVYFLLFMRILGTVFTFSNAVISLVDLYQDLHYKEYRIIMGDLVFPIRDLVEILFFSYLFYH